MATTYEEVWALMHALIASQQETDRKFQETDHRFQETERLLKEQSQETNRRFQESDRRFQETERLLKQQSQDTDRKIKEVSTQIGKLGNRLGDFVEDNGTTLLVTAFSRTRIRSTPRIAEPNCL